MLALIWVCFLISIVQRDFVHSLCFPEEKSETCFSCSSDYYSPGKIYTYADEKVIASSCTKRNSSYVPRRKLLVGFFDQHSDCLQASPPSEVRCVNLFNFLKEFDAYYENLYDAFLEENKILSRFENSSAYFYVFGEVRAHAKDGSVERIQFFRRVFSQIFLIPLNCIEYAQQEICLFYKSKMPALLFKIENQLTIFVASSLTIFQINFNYKNLTSTKEIGDELTFIQLEPNLDQKINGKTELVLTNCTIWGLSSDSFQGSFVALTKLGGTVRVTYLVVKMWVFGAFLSVQEDLDARHNNEQSKALLICLENSNSIIFTSVSFSNIPKMKGFRELFSLSSFVGKISFEEIIIDKMEGNSFAFKNCNGFSVALKNLSASNSVFDSLLLGSGTEIFLDGLYLVNVSFSSSSLIAITDCQKSEISKMQITGVKNTASASKGPVISILNCKLFAVRRSGFYASDGFELEVILSMVLVQNTNFLKLKYYDFIFNALFSNSTFSYCVFTEVEGPGVIFKQFKEDLIILNTKLSYIKGIVIINFDELRSNVIAHCEITLINNPQYFWARNLQVINQSLVNCTFSNSFFLRIQSFYRVFAFYPFITYKDCSFINMTFGFYGFDYCCLDLIIINVMYINIEMLKGTSRGLYAIEQNGKFAYINSTFTDIGWLTYEISPSGGYNQVLIALWYPGSFLLRNCTFLFTRKMSLRSGFITSQDLITPILIENSSFIVQNPSLELPVKGMILLAIALVEIKHCVFVNLTGDFISMAYSHINGVISLLGSLSLLEKRSNSNAAVFENVTIINSTAKNGAAVSVISYNSLKIQNCNFHNGTAKNGLGGLLTIVFVQNLFLETSNFSKGAALSGGCIYLKDIGSGKLKNLSFFQSESSESGGCFAIISSRISVLNANIFSSRSLGTGGVIYQQNGQLRLENLMIRDANASYDGGVFSMEDVERLEAVKSSFSLIQSGEKGGILFGEVRTIILHQITSTDILTKDDGTVLSLENFFEIIISQATFNSLKCTELCKNGLIVVKTLVINSTIQIESNVFIDSAASNGGIIFVFSDIKLLMRRIKITSWKGGNILSLSGFSSIEIYMENFTVSGAYCNDPSMFKIKKGHCNLNDFTLADNYFVTQIIELIESAAHFERVGFKNNSNLGARESFTSFFYLSDTYLSIIRFVFEFQNAGPSISSNSDSSNSLINVFSAEISTLIVSSVAANLTDLTFVSGTAFDLVLTSINIAFMPSGDIYALIDFSSPESRLIRLSNCHFSLTKGTALKIKQPGSVIIVNCSFLGLGNVFTIIRQAVQAEGIGFLTVLDANFTNLAARSGSALSVGYSEATVLVLVSRSQFNYCSSILGGAIFISSYFNITILESKFKGNQARERKNETEDGIGGVAYLACPPERANLSCKGEISNCTFEDNLAEEYGPTVYTNIFLETKGSNHFRDNTDVSNFAKEFSSYPLRIMKNVSNNESQLKFSLKSGQPENLTLYLTDFFGNVYSFDDQSSAKFLPKEAQANLFVENDFCVARKGVLSFPNLLVKGPSNSNVSLALDIQFQHDPVFPLLKLRFSVDFYILPCHVGEIVQLDFTCKRCESGTYSFSEANKIKECIRCLDHFECLGGDEIFPVPGYWRFKRHSQQAIKCPLENACLGGTKTNMTERDIIHGACAEGHFGNLCYNCINGYGKFEKGGLCEPCNKDRPLFVVRIVLTSIFLAAYIVLNAYLFSLDLASQQTASPSDFIDMKILFSHFQTISITTFMEDVSSLPSMNEMVQFQSYFSFINDDIISIECIIQDYFNKQFISMYKVLVTVVLPFAIGTGALIFWITFAFVYSVYLNVEKLRNAAIATSPSRVPSASRKGIFFKRIIISFAVGAYLLYPMILQSAFSLPNCIPIADEEQGVKDFLYVSPNIRCWESDHLNYIYFLFFPSIILWAVAFPISLYYLLKMSKSPSKQVQVNKILSQISINSKKRRLLALIEDKIFRFFYEDYKDKFFYWEIMIFSKKFILIAMSSIRNMIGRDLKFILIILALLLYGVIVVNKRPFKSEICNRFEIISCVICIFTVLLLTVINFEQRAEVVMGLGFITVLMNGLFIAMLVLNIARKVLKKIALKRNQFFKSKLIKSLPAKLWISKQSSTNSRIEVTKSVQVSRKNNNVPEAGDTVQPPKTSHYFKPGFNLKSKEIDA